MLKILWKRGEIAPEEQFLLLSTIFYYLILDFYVKTGIRFSLRDRRLFEITEIEITRVDCISKLERGIALVCYFEMAPTIRHVNMCQLAVRPRYLGKAEVFSTLI